MILRSDKLFQSITLCSPILSRSSQRELYRKKTEIIMFATEYDFNYIHLPWLVSVSVSFPHFIVSDRRANQRGENRNHITYKTTVNHLSMTGMEDLPDVLCQGGESESRALLVVISTYGKRKSANQMQQDIYNNHGGVFYTQLQYISASPVITAWVVNECFNPKASELFSETSYTAYMVNSEKVWRCETVQSYKRALIL